MIHTGEHYDAELSDVFFRDLAVPSPAINLEIGSGTNGIQTGRMLEAVFLEQRPDLVLVYGDTNSTLAAALAAAKLHIPIGHVEAGLRSFNRRMPEEVNRVLVDHTASFLFCPTDQAVENLRREGITKGVHLVGDVMYDCVLAFGQVATMKSQILERLHLTPKAYFLATVHRADNTTSASRLQAVVDALTHLQTPETPVVLPLHPRTRQALSQHRIEGWETLTVTPPLPYTDLHTLLANSRCLLTDSGGMQKEAFFHRVPCVTLRDDTEWVETVTGGYNRLVGADTARIIEAAATATFPNGAPPPAFYGDGHAGQAIIDILLRSAP